MGNCFRKLFRENYNPDILDNEFQYSPPSAPLATDSININSPRVPQSSSVYNSALEHSVMSTNSY